MSYACIFYFIFLISIGMMFSITLCINQINSTTMIDLCIDQINVFLYNWVHKIS